ncbi:MAG: tRNA pseudouridine(55) synthase TruB, partial [Phycisphaerae bacterium]
EDDRVRTALMSFEGTIEQVPPAVSAIKVGGVAAYKRTARGQTVRLDARRVRVYWVCVHRVAWPEIEFGVCCGRGTYIRSIVRDLGEKLGTGGCLTGLVRERVGPFALHDAWTLERLRKAGGPDEYVIPLERAKALLSPDTVSIPERPSPD